MLSVFGLTCNGLRDGRGLVQPLVLSWRLGSDRAGAAQVSYRIVVTSAADGTCRWDSGVVASAANEVVYAGEPLEAGEECVWFVSVADDAGEEDYGVPSTFGVAKENAGDDSGKGAGETSTVGAHSLLGPERRGFVWTSNEQVNESIEREGLAEALDGAWWREVLGVSLAGDEVHVSPRLDDGLAHGLSFVRGSLLVSRGLLLVGCERAGGGTVRVRVSLPPGMYGALELGEKTFDLCSGTFEAVERL